MKFSMMSRTALGLAVVLGAAVSSASAQIQYIDAVVQGMTGTVNTTGPAGAAASATAWQIRGTNGGADTSSYSNEGSAFQYNTNPIDASNPTLTTTVTGLDAGKTYEVFVFYWDDLGNEPDVIMPANSPWDVAAKLPTDANYTQFDSSQTSNAIVTTDLSEVGGVDATASGYSIIKFSDIAGLNVLGQTGDADGYADAYDGNRAMFGGLLPSTVSGATSFSVDLQASANSTNRSWYDGIGVREIPEPSTLVLLGLGFMGIACGRRK